MNRGLTQYKRLIVGFSGGLDSTVLLHQLAVQPMLAKKLLAVHVHHGLSVNANDWQQHCQQVCDGLNIPLIVKQVVVNRPTNIEEEAREARYAAFASLVQAEDCLLLAHHLDDQAETLLLQLFRGAGIDGLAAMPVKKAFAKATLFRPLLAFSRQNLEDYAKVHQLQWIDDESNQDISFSRNFLRQQVLPLLLTRWPGVVNNLVRTTHHCQQAQRNLEALAQMDSLGLDKPILDLKALSHLPEDRLANVLRFWIKANKVKLPGTLIFNRIIHEVIRAKPDASPEVQWMGFSVRRYQQKLYLMQDLKDSPLKAQIWTSFPEPLLIEGLGHLRVQKAERGFNHLTEGQMELRFRQGGEFMKWHGQNKPLKKLFQDWQVPPWLRNRIPLLYVDEQLAVVVGYAVSDHFYKESEKDLSLAFNLSPQ